MLIWPLAVSRVRKDSDPSRSSRTASSAFPTREVMIAATFSVVSGSRSLLSGRPSMFVTTIPRTPSCDLSLAKMDWSFSCVITVRIPRYFDCALTTTTPQLSILDLWRYVAVLYNKLRILNIFEIVLHKKREASRAKTEHDNTLLIKTSVNYSSSSSLRFLKRVFELRFICARFCVKLSSATPDGAAAGAILIASSWR